MKKNLDFVIIGVLSVIAVIVLFHRFAPNVAVAHLQPLKKGIGAVTLRYKYKKGTYLSYSLTLEGKGKAQTSTFLEGDTKAPAVMQSFPLDMAMSVFLKTIVLEVTSEGKTYLETHIGGMKVAQNGKVVADLKQGETPAVGAEFSDALNNPLISAISSTGRILDSGGADGFSGVAPMVDFSSILIQTQLPLPEEPVFMGSTWSVDMPSSNCVPGQKPVPALRLAPPRRISSGSSSDAPTPDVQQTSISCSNKAVYTIVGEKFIYKRKCLRIHASYSGDSTAGGENVMKQLAAFNVSMDSGKIKYEGDFYFDPVSGMVVYQTFNMNQTLSGAMKMPVQGAQGAMNIDASFDIAGAFMLE